MAADPKISKENFSPPVEVALLTPPRPGIDRADAMPTVPPSVTVTATGPRWWVDLTPTLRAVVVAGLLIAVGYLIRALAPVLTPFIAGAILSYIAAPVVAWLAARRVPRSAGAVMIVLTIGALIAGLVLVVVPLVGFDARCQRLGMGGGWYDRSFASRQLHPAPPWLVGAGFAAQQVARIDAETWDVTLDAVCCEDATHIAAVIK